MENEKRAAMKRAERDRQEDVVLNRVLVWFGGAVLAEFLLLFLNRYYINYRTTEIEFALSVHRAVSVLIAVGAVGAVLFLVWFVARRRSGKKALLPGFLTGLFAALTVICLAAQFFQATGIQFLCAAVPAAAVLALIFYLYQREFFTVTVLTAIGIVGLWVLRKANGGHAVVVYGYMAAAAVVLVAAVLLCRKLQQTSGAWGEGEKKVQLFHKNAKYGMVYTTCGIVAAALIAGVVLGLSVAYYLIFALVAWLFVMAVYYTVKLM